MSSTDVLADLESITSIILRDRPMAVSLNGRDVAVDYIDDPEEGREYARIAVGLPDDWYAEIDSQTYGTLWAVRLYLDDDGWTQG